MSEKKFLAGFGLANITPEESVPMASYGDDLRRFSEGKFTELEARGLAITDTEDNTSLFITCDLSWCPSYLGKEVLAVLTEELGLPVVTNVLAVEPAEGGVQLKQETDEGYRIVTAPIPCVVTIVKPEYEPRYPSIKSKMAARKMPVGALTTADVEADAAKFGPEGAKTERVAISAPAKREAGVKIQEKEAAVAVSRALEMMAGQKLI